MVKRPYSIRQEANALTCAAFRNGMLEDLHAGEPSPLTQTPGLSRITDAEMKALMIEASAFMARLLAWKELDPVKYWQQIEFFHQNYCRNWDETEIDPNTPTAQLRAPRPGR